MNIRTELAARLAEAIAKDRNIPLALARRVAGEGQKVSEFLDAVAEALAVAYASTDSASYPTAEAWFGEEVDQPGCTVRDALAKMDPVEAARMAFGVGMLGKQFCAIGPAFKSADEWLKADLVAIAGMSPVDAARQGFAAGRCSQEWTVADEIARLLPMASL